MSRCSHLPVWFIRSMLVVSLLPIAFSLLLLLSTLQTQALHNHAAQVHCALWRIADHLSLHGPNADPAHAKQVLSAQDTPLRVWWNAHPLASTGHLMILDQHQAIRLDSRHPAHQGLDLAQLPADFRPLLWDDGSVQALQIAGANYRMYRLTLPETGWELINLSEEQPILYATRRGVLLLTLGWLLSGVAVLLLLRLQVKTESGNPV